MIIVYICGPRNLLLFHVKNVYAFHSQCMLYGRVLEQIMHSELNPVVRLYLHTNQNQSLYIRVCFVVMVKRSVRLISSVNPQPVLLRDVHARIEVHFRMGKSSQGH